MIFPVSICLLPLLLLFGFSHSGEIITSPPITNWGNWGALDRCPNGTFARGFRLKTEPFRGPLIDDSAGNAIRLFCGDPFDPSTPSVISAEGAFGNWGFTMACPTGSYINGFSLRVESPGLVSDETATNNVRFYCNDPQASYIQGDGLNFGQWRDLRVCGSTQALCAFQTQVQPSAGALVDDTSLNNIAGECCDLPVTIPPTTPTTSIPTTNATTPNSNVTTIPTTIPTTIIVTTPTLSTSTVPSTTVTPTNPPTVVTTTTTTPTPSTTSQTTNSTTTPLPATTSNATLPSITTISPNATTILPNSTSRVFE